MIIIRTHNKYFYHQKISIFLQRIYISNDKNLYNSQYINHLKNEMQ